MDDVQTLELVDIVNTDGFVHWFSRVNQFLSWPIIFLALNLLLRIDISGRDNLRKIEAPFLIVANHVTFYDSFVFRIALGFFTSHLPLRFMAVTRFRSRALNVLSAIGIIDLVYALFGVFTIVPGQGIEKGTAKALHILKSGGNVVMYPEGSISLVPGTIQPFRKGAAVLALRTGLPVIPVTMKLGGTGFLRRRFAMKIGEPLQPPQASSADEITEKFHETLTGMYAQMS